MVRKPTPPKPLPPMAKSVNDYYQLMKTYIGFQLVWNAASKKAQARFVKAIPPARPLVEVVKKDAETKNTRRSSGKNSKAYEKARERLLDV